MKALSTEHAGVQGRTILGALEATTRVVLDADQAYIQQAIGSVQWERSGLLQKLTRVDRPSADATTDVAPELATGLTA